MIKTAHTPSTAFTLLEVLLTLAMSVVLMGLVGGAIQFYARDMNVRDMDIRQTQLAVAVMQMIEDDLRATLHGEPVDTAGLESLLASTAGQASGGGGESADLSAAGIESATTTDLAETTDLATVDLASGTTVLQTPGLIGNQFQIQIDLSRLPRLEEYVALFDETTADIDDVPSDLKTVSYFVQGAGMIGGVQDALDSLDPNAALAGGSGGLVRRSLDRAATAHASATGGLTLLNQTGELLAPEIQAIEFSYWDGLTWQFQWSSDEYGELPLAVKVQLTMASPIAELTSGSLGTDAAAIRTFTHVVRLPLARPIDTTAEDLSEAGL